MDYRFLRFHVHDKYQEVFKKAFIEVLSHTSQEEGCVYIHGYDERGHEDQVQSDQLLLHRALCAPRDRGCILQANVFRIPR